MSRPPKAQIPPGCEITAAWADSLLGRADDRRLLWNASREEILRDVGSVGGLARLAKVERVTVYRQGLAPGSLQALVWVLDRRRAMGRPLVETKEIAGQTLRWVPDHRAGPKRLNVAEDLKRISLRAKHPRFVDVMDRIEEAKYARMKLVAVHDSRLKKPTERRLNQPMRRKQAVRYADEVRAITGEERRYFEQMEKRGLVVRTQKAGMPIKALCGLLGLSRMGFWKWRKSLPFALREQLAAALRG